MSEIRDTRIEWIKVRAHAPYRVFMVPTCSACGGKPAIIWFNVVTREARCADGCGAKLDLF